MALPSPTRAALPSLALALGVLAVVAAGFVAARWDAPLAAQAQRLDRDATLLLAAVENGAPSLKDIATDHYRADSASAATPSIFVVDRDGGVQRIYRPSDDEARVAAEEAIAWRTLLAQSASGPVQRLELEGAPFVVAMREASNGRAHLALVAPTVPAGRAALLARTGGILIGVWLLIALAIGWTLRRVVGRPLAEVTDLARRLADHVDAEGDAEALEALRREAEDTVKPVAAPLFRLVDAVDALSGQLSETRTQLNALFQVHNSYVLLVTLEGTIIDANPAFYAVSGLAPEGVRGASSGVLDEVMPLEPVLQLAQRSQSEGAAFADIDYALKSKEGATRPLKLSLLAVRSDGRAAVLIVAADKMKERTLERQIEAFSDSLDLMVKKRLSELTDGEGGVERLVAAAGAVLVAFDGEGGPQRWNAAAARLTGLAADQAPRLEGLAQALGVAGADAAHFDGWLRSTLDEPCVVTVRDGSPAAQLYAWQRAVVDAGHAGERRVLVGVPLPPLEDAGPAPAAPSAEDAAPDPLASDADEADPDEAGTTPTAGAPSPLVDTVP